VENAVVGTPYYMAPEQWVRPAEVDGRVDVYSLAVLAFECLTGRRPFDGASTRAIARAHLTEPLPALGDALPAAMDGVLARAAAKRPADRLASALAFASALRAASGIDPEPVGFPQLDESVCAAAMADAPQPLADAVALLGAALNAHQARDAALRVVRVALRYIGVISVASRTQVGPGPQPDGESTRDLLRALGTRPLAAGEWIALSRELCRPFVAARDAHPVPELVALWFPEAEDERGGAEVLESLAATADAESGSSMADGEIREALARWMRDLAVALRALAFVSDYRLVVPFGSHTEVWMGGQRRHRPRVPVVGAALEPGHPALVNDRGEPVLSLWPLAQIAAPSPGADDELFLFEGRGRGGARLIAQPHGFELTDDALWEWLRDRLIGEAPELESDVEQRREPYRGLRAFGRDDAGWFFGRERESEAVCNRLRASPMLAVVGASGAGKSSFVQAGVLPRLEPEWSAITVRPGTAPIASLCARLAAAGAGDLRERFAADPDALGDALREAARKRGGGLVLVVDQFEELFTLGDSDSSAAYARALLRAARSAEDPVRVVMTLRDDFLIRAGELPELGRRLSNSIQILTTPPAEALERMLVEPARRAGFEFDDASLPARMVRELADSPGALPLLSFTAAALWKVRDRHFRQLRARSYDALGGVAGALAGHAEATLSAMSADARGLVRLAFRHLVTAEGTRVISSRAELLQVLGDDSRAGDAIGTLVESRLLVAGEGDGGEQQLEIAHEALISAWPRLVAWRHEDAEGARLRDQLRIAARQWDERGRPRGQLWRGEALTELELWRRRFPRQLTAAAAAFAAASRAEAARGRRLRTLLIVSAFAMLSAALAAVLWLNSRTAREFERAEQSSAEATRRLLDMRLEQGRQAYVRGEPLTALVYLDDAHQRGARDPMLQFLLGGVARSLGAQQLAIDAGGGWVRAARFASGGTRVVTSGDAAVWDATTGESIRTLPTAAFTIALDPSTERAATGGIDGTVSVWDVDTGRRIAGRSDHRGRVYCVDFDAAGNRVISGDDAGIARIWTVADSSVVVELAHGEGSIFDCEISADGARALTTGLTTKLWNARTGALIATWGPAGERTDATFSPDGTLVAIASIGRRNVVIRRVADGDIVAVLRGHSRGVVQSTFNADASRLITAGLDHSARVWDTATGELLTTLDGHTGEVLTVELSCDGRLAATGSADRTAAVWDAASGRRLSSLVGHIDKVTSVQFDPRGERLLTSGFDGTARIWSTAEQGLALSIGDDEALIVAGVFTDDGRRLLTQTVDQTAALWDASDGRRVATVAAESHPFDVSNFEILEAYRVTPSVHGAPDRVALPAGDTVRVVDASTGRTIATLAPGQGKVTSARLFADGTQVVVAAGTRAEVWRVDGAVREGVFEHVAPVLAAEPSPDGRTVATASLDGAARLWDVQAGTLRRSLEGHRFGVAAVAFVDGGARLVTASPDGTARVWDAESGADMLTMESDAPLCGVAASPDGTRIAAIDCGGDVVIWDRATGRLLERHDTGGSHGFWIAFSPTGDRLVVANGRAQVLDVALDEQSAQQWKSLADASPYRLDGERIVVHPD
jgi:WD40 repeat protein